jgi:hypothetical protein
MSYVAAAAAIRAVAEFQFTTFQSHERLKTSKPHCGQCRHVVHRRGGLVFRAEEAGSRDPREKHNVSTVNFGTENEGTPDNRQGGT